MYNLDSDSEISLKNAVTAEDVLRIYRNINNSNLCSLDIIKLENKLLINSFSNNHFLYSNKYLYYNLSMMLKDIGLFYNDSEYIKKMYNILLTRIKNIVENNFDDVFYLKEKIESELVDNLYIELFNQPLSLTSDLLKVCNNLNSNNDAFKEVIKLEIDLFINKFYKNKFLFSNRFIYFKLVTLIKQVGLNTYDIDLINNTFATVTKASQTILNANNVDDREKIIAFNNLCFNYISLENSNEKIYKKQLIDANEFTNNYILDNFKYNEKKKQKVLTYTMKEACVL